ncbi:DUF6263 family protein [Capnocytophaga sp. G2]|jgi:hypothetical protein|uniref:DUF6263 family protein n=1 Tax=Capnocytophaga sp. G2 TaxID=3110695 RepID=UPI002B46DFBE|nr:DUF6263 family protein [Capnocytophaga sp. G2]MEB3004588.1 DUF6263 family protein [Capnocytophaga sp. G2]
MKYLLFFLPFLGYAQAIDLSLSLNPREKYYQNILSEVSSKQEIEGAQVETKARSEVRIRYTVGREDKMIYPMSLRYEQASLQMETKVNGQVMPLGKIPDYTNQAAKELCKQPLKGELSTKGKIVKLSETKPLIERAMKHLEKKQPKDAPLTSFEKQQVQAQLEAAFSETTLQSNLSNVLSVLPRQRVHVGDSWEISSFLSKEMNVNIKTQYTLMEATEQSLYIQGKAKIATNKEKVILQQGQYVFFTMNGEIIIHIWLDPSSRWIQKASAEQTLKGETEVEGDLSHQKGKVIPFESKSVIKVNIQ